MLNIGVRRNLKLAETNFVNRECVATISKGDGEQNSFDRARSRNEFKLGDCDSISIGGKPTD